MGSNNEIENNILAILRIPKIKSICTFWQQNFA